MTMGHPHEMVLPVPDRLPKAVVQELSELRPAQAVRAIVEEWLGIALALGLGVWAEQAFAWAWLLWVPWMGARQHALAVLAHDAVHFRLLPGRLANDAVGNVLLAWPVFISVEGFRHFHGSHHQHLGGDKDGNRQLWRTHDASGQLTAEWTFPKSALGLGRMLLLRSAGLTGLWWLFRGVVGGLFFGVSRRGAAVRLLFYVALAACLTALDGWGVFLRYWLVPYCTWHVAIQYLRLVCEHSAVRSEDRRYAETRTTIPGLLGRLFVLPRHIGYHIEHHWYPSVPFYRLPELHERLMQQAPFRAHAEVHRSLPASVRAVLSR